MKYILFFVFLLVSEKVHAQRTLNHVQVGAVAPDIKVKKWIKGSAIDEFAKGEIYVLEFWATWCVPCINYMPHLSRLANKYKNQVTFIGVSVYEEPKTSIIEIEHFVNSMGNKMNYNVAVDSNNYMANNWLSNPITKSIPKIFIINKYGFISWIGHPKELDTVLHKVIIDEFNINSEINKLKEAQYIDSIGLNFSYSMLDYPYLSNPDSAVIETKRRILIEPKLKKSYYVAFLLFKNLLQKNQIEAVSYGEEILNYNVSDLYKAVYENVLLNVDISLKPEIYSLSAKAYTLALEHDKVFQEEELAKAYVKIAEWYWRDNKIEESLKAQEKAISYFEIFFNNEIQSLKEKLSYYKSNEN